MSPVLVWISGASGGIGLSLARSLPWEGARIIGVSRHPPSLPVQGLDSAEFEHLEADLSGPAGWSLVAASFHRELDRFDGERVVFVHAAGTVEPVGFAAEVDTESYVPNVVLNSAAPQVLGHMFLVATAGMQDRHRHLVMITSGAAKGVYAGWSSYGAGKAAVDQWVRNAGAEQAMRGGVQVLAVAPGTVDTGMQARLRAATERDFPSRAKFVDLYDRGGLADPDDIARRIWSLVVKGRPTGSVLDLRDL